MIEAASLETLFSISIAVFKFYAKWLAEAALIKKKILKAILASFRISPDYFLTKFGFKKNA